MITQTIRNKVDALWDVFYSGGISNPLLVIEQITYLMFIHNLGQIDEDRERASKMLGMDSYAWSSNPWPWDFQRKTED